MIPYGKQQISQADIDAVTEVLTSDYLTQGPKVPLFESTLAKLCGSQFGIAANSATSALHIACLALNVDSKDIVWTTPITFVASANCALYCGASVDFVDIDIDTGLMSVQALQQKLEQAKKSNTLPLVVIPVHLAGQSCDMKSIKALSLEYGFSIIEDASHAIGGHYQNLPIGNCQYSDITIFSFHPVKIVTCAEGGVALTNNADLAKKMQLYRSHGITSNAQDMDEESHGPWYYQQIALGFNYRMTELQAALGLSQLTCLEAFVAKRNALAQVYDQAFSSSALTSLTTTTDNYSAYHLYIVLLPDSDKEKHKAVITALRNREIFAHVHYIPVHLQPFYKKLGFAAGDFPVAEEYYSRAISLPLYPELTEDEQGYIIKTILELL
ncbi:UDP-4-amino-4,6-dideoxy-N-acetyl-beta-L-altrosami ne transaminase [Colwellia asteriadis]|uniref:UDP-4-amino-4, 6-dideoxy-N-acetyl-beta-L-altrosami ne transaminase n=1 Tax=Colwellia asteriadis TaxID=517723 RepID=A0ABN1L5W1_9GAMM